MLPELPSSTIPETPRDTLIINALSAYVEPWMHDATFASEFTRAQAASVQRQALEKLREQFPQEYQAGGQFTQLTEYFLQEHFSQEEIDDFMIDYYKTKYRSAIEARIEKADQFATKANGQPYFDLTRYEMLYGMIPRRDLASTDTFATEESSSTADILSAFGFHPPANAVAAIEEHLTASTSTEHVDLKGVSPSWETQEFSLNHPDVLEKAFLLYRESKGDLDAAQAGQAFALFAKLYYEDNLDAEHSLKEIYDLMRSNSEYRRKVIKHYNATRQIRRMAEDFQHQHAQES